MCNAQPTNYGNIQDLHDQNFHLIFCFINFLTIKGRKLCMCKKIDNKCVALWPKISMEFLGNPFIFNKILKFDGSIYLFIFFVT